MNNIFPLVVFYRCIIVPNNFSSICCQFLRFVYIFLEKFASNKNCSFSIFFILRITYIPGHEQSLMSLRFKSQNKFLPPRRHQHGVSRGCYPETQYLCLMTANVLKEPLKYDYFRFFYSYTAKKIDIFWLNLRFQVMDNFLWRMTFSKINNKQIFHMIPA